VYTPGNARGSAAERHLPIALVLSPSLSCYYEARLRVALGTHALYLLLAITIIRKWFILADCAHTFDGISTERQCGWELLVACHAISASKHPRGDVKARFLHHYDVLFAINLCSGCFCFHFVA
jgi:hypothetical protein